jgi:hypothetical protein
MMLAIGDFIRVTGHPSLFDLALPPLMEIHWRASR